MTLQLGLFAEFFEWYISDKAIANRTGRWFLTVLNLKKPMNISEFAERKPVPRVRKIAFKSYWRTFYTISVVTG